MHQIEEPENADWDLEIFELDRFVFMQEAYKAAVKHIHTSIIFSMNSGTLKKSKKSMKPTTLVTLALFSTLYAKFLPNLKIYSMCSKLASLL